MLQNFHFYKIKVVANLTLNILAAAVENLIKACIVSEIRRDFVEILTHFYSVLATPSAINRYILPTSGYRESQCCKIFQFIWSEMFRKKVAWNCCRGIPYKIEPALEELTPYCTLKKHQPQLCFVVVHTMSEAKHDDWKISCTCPKCLWLKES